MAEELRIGVREAKRRVVAGDAIVLDVVAPDTWRELEVAIPGALRIDPREIDARYGELPREKTIVAYCT